MALPFLRHSTGLAICPIGGINCPRSVTIQMQIHILIQLVSVLAHANGKIHTLIVQPALLYGWETVPMTGSHVKKMEVTKMKMSRWACGHTLRDHVRHYNMRERLKVENITERCRKARLRWSGRSLPPRGRRKRGRPKQRWMDCANRDMRAIGTTKDEVHDRTGWRRIVSATATPQQVGAARRRSECDLERRLNATNRLVLQQFLLQLEYLGPQC